MDIALLLILGMFIGLAIVTAIAQARINYASLHEAALKQFREVTVHSNDRRLTFVGSTAEVIKEEETGNNPRQNGAKDYVLTVYARNESGEYFMFRSGTPKPYIKHIEHSVARALLKNAYVLPKNKD